jgi:hypothetical protein
MASSSISINVIVATVPSKRGVAEAPDDASSASGSGRAWCAAGLD